MSDIIQRFTSLLSSNSGTVGTSAIQISGGPSTSWPLTGVSSSFFPNYHRAAVRVVNTSGAGTIYLGSTSSVTAGAGGGWFKALGPGQFFEIPASGAVPIWIVASAAGTGFTVEELS